MTPAAYVVKDGLVGHQWEKKPWSCQGWTPPPPCRGMSGRGSRKWEGLGRGITHIEEGGMEMG